MYWFKLSSKSNKAFATFTCKPPAIASHDELTLLVLRYPRKATERVSNLQVIRRFSRERLRHRTVLFVPGISAAITGQPNANASSGGVIACAQKTRITRTKAF